MFIRANHQVKHRELRLIDENGEQVGVVSADEARKRAKAVGLDLVEISPSAKPPVCKIMDFGKFKYDVDKKKKEAKKKQAAVKVKEIKYHANVDEHDYQTKLRRAKEFLGEGNRIKCSLFFRGRENAHTEVGVDLFKRIVVDLEPVGKVEQMPRLNGKNLSMLINPLNQK